MHRPASCNYCAEMTVLTVGHFAGSGVGYVPERHIDLDCRLVAFSHACCPRQSQHSVLALWNRASESFTQSCDRTHPCALLCSCTLGELVACEALAKKL
jgi:hypothetical protein